MPAEAQGSLYSTSSGYGIRWRENGKRRFRSCFETKRDARRWFEDGVRPRLRGRSRESSSSTLAAFSETWLTAHAADVEPGTITTLRYRLAHALDAFGDVPLADLQRHALEIAAWRVALPERLRYPATSALRQALGAAVAWELIDENPAKKAGKNPQPKARETRPLTVEELGRVVGGIGAHGSHRGDGTPTVRMARARRARRRPGGTSALRRAGRRRRTYGKTAASRRRVPLTAAALDALDDLPARIDSPLVFPAVRGGYMNLRNWR
jgi:integrase